MKASIELPPKRRFLYDLLLKLAGLEEGKIVSEGQVTSELRKLKENLAPINGEFSKFAVIFIGQATKTFEGSKTLKKIKDLDFLKLSKARLMKISPLSKDEGEALQRLEGLFASRISELEEELKPHVPTSPETLSELLLKLDSALDMISNKMQTSIVVSRGEEWQRTSSLKKEISQLYGSLADFLSGDLDLDKFKDIVGSIAKKLRYKDSLFTYAQMERALRDGRIDVKKSKELLLDVVKPRLVEGFLLQFLVLLGPQTLKKIREDSGMPQKDLFDAAKSLLAKKRVEIVGYEGIYPIFCSLKEKRSDIVEGLRESVRELTIAKMNLGMKDGKRVENIILKCRNLVGELEKIAEVNDELFKEELLVIKKCLEGISEFSKEKAPVKELENVRDSLLAMTDAYNQFRLSFIAEKGKYLAEKNVYGEPLDEERYLELLSSTIDAEYERQRILRFIRDHQPSSVPTIANAIGLPLNRVHSHMIQLRQLGLVNIKGEENGYLLYDVPRKLPEEVIVVDNFIMSMDRLHANFQECIKILKDLNAENIGALTAALNGINASLQNLIEFASNAGDLSAVLADFQGKMSEWVNLSTEVRDRLPKVAVSKVRVEDLAPVDVPEVDPLYLELVKTKPLFDFGTIHWNDKQCLACRSCQEVCPEAALELKPSWDVSTIFKMTEDDLQKVPESKRMLYRSILKLAKVKPVMPIKLPNETLGLGKIDSNPTRCIACRECETRCPNEAIKIEEIWNFPEIIKSLISK